MQIDKLHFCVDTYEAITKYDNFSAVILTGSFAFAQFSPLKIHTYMLITRQTLLHAINLL